MGQKWFFPILLVLLLLNLVTCQGNQTTRKSTSDLARSAEKGSITIAWDPNSESNLGGYKVFCGTSPGKYTYSVNVGKVTKYTLTNLVKGKTYYIAVVAYLSNSSVKSGFSKEVSGVAK
jgi:hypothetical protein